MRDTANVSNIQENPVSTQIFLSDTSYYKSSKDNSANFKDKFVTSIFNKHELNAASSFSNIEPNHRPYTADFIFLLTITIFIALINIFNQKRLRLSTLSFFSHRNYSNLEKEGRIISHPTSIALYIIYLINISFLLNEYFFANSGFLQFYPKYSIILSIFTILLVFTQLKTMFVKFSSFIFKSEVAGNIYTIRLYLMYNNLSVLIFPLVWAHIYLSNPIWGIIALVFISLLSLYRFLTFFKYVISVSNFSLFQIILYLCTVEILPLVVLTKIGIMYL